MLATRSRDSRKGIARHPCTNEHSLDWDAADMIKSIAKRKVLDPLENRHTPATWKVVISSALYGNLCGRIIVLQCDEKNAVFVA